MTLRSSRSVGRRKNSSPALRKQLDETAETPTYGPAEAAGDSDVVDVTAERVIQEYARIAFADLRRLADWGPNGFVLKLPQDLSDADAAAISEIVSGSSGPRIKLYDKKAALDALARHLGLFSPTAPRREAGEAPEAAEDPREVLARRLARLAAGTAAQ